MFLIHSQTLSLFFSNPLGTINLLCVYGFSYFEHFIKYSQAGELCIWVLSFRIMFSVFAHEVACIGNPFLSVAVSHCTAVHPSCQRCVYADTLRLHGSLFRIQQGRGILLQNLEKEERELVSFMEKHTQPSEQWRLPALLNCKNAVALPCSVSIPSSKHTVAQQRVGRKPAISSWSF